MNPMECITEGLMVADLKNLSESIRESTPENYLKQMICSRRPEIEAALRNGETYTFRVPDGRQIHIKPRRLASPPLEAAISLESAIQSAHQVRTAQ